MAEHLYTYDDPPNQRHLDQICSVLDKNGVVVMLPRLGLEAPVIFAGDSGYELDRDAMGLTSPAAKAKRIRVLDRVRVRIEVIDHLLLLN